MSSQVAATDGTPALVGIRTRARILELLETARRERCVLTLTDGSGTIRNSTILAYEPGADLLRLDEPADGWPDSRAELRCTVRVDGLHFQFHSRLDAERCSIRVPGELTYREHRSRFRARVPHSERAGIEIEGLRGNLRNLSTTGFGGYFDAAASEPLEAAIGREHAATLQLGDEPALTLRVRIRHLDRTGGSRVLIGGDFTAPRPEDLQRLRRWSMTLERIALQRRQKLES